MDQNRVAAEGAPFDPARERTALVNALAEAARVALEFDFMSAAVLGAIPGTEPQQYVIAGTPAGISKMLPTVAAPSPVSEAQAEPDECGANMNGHRFGPHGRNGERQCEWCGSAPTAKEAEQASAQAAPQAVLLVGAKMANTMFNLAQRAGDVIDGDLAARFDSMRKEWDAAVRAAPSCAQAAAAEARGAARDWSEGERIASVPIVDDALRGFSEDPTGDNGICVVLAVLDSIRSAVGTGEQA